MMNKLIRQLVFNVNGPLEVEGAVVSVYFILGEIREEELVETN
jgi:hypothetical protein